MSNEMIDQLVEAVETKQLTRREFIRRSTALGLSMASALSIAGRLGSRSAYAAQVDRGKLSKTLNLYNWSDYIGEDTISGFEKEFGVKVTYDTYEDNERLLAKLMSGATGYDVVVPTSYMVDIMIKQKLLAPLNHENIPNLKGVTRELLDTPFDPGNRYSVPYQWGTTGFGYNSEKITGTVDSWDIFWDPRYKGKITMLDEMRALFSVALKRLGYSLNSTSEKQLMEAKKLLLEQKSLLKAYISAPVKGLLISGEVWLAELWSGDVFMAKAENDAIEYCIPKEGCEVWTDNLVIPKSAPHKYTAEAWLNYNLRPDVSAGVSNTVHYASPVEGAKSFLNKADLKNPGIYPPAETLERLEFVTDVGEATRIYDRIWIELKGA
ncbi:MAG: spermidine/putrescine ABC transporter substrate-binding protein [Desulfobacterales bacterium]